MRTWRKILMIILAVSGLLPARESERKYGWPLSIRDGVSSSFQEFRSNHFHAGIDLRTLQHTGFPVLAIADGWIERISISNRNYGRMLRLKHADGNYSLYGHLERFRDDIEAIVARVRIARGERYFSDHVLPAPVAVRRGETIAFSGESGAGFAHLHVEIRDGADRALNPLMLMNAISPDAYPPCLKGVLLRSREGSQVNGNCGEFYFKLRRQGTEYTLARPLEISGACDVALEAIDLSDVRHVIAPCGLEASLDGKPVFSVSFERLTRDDNNQLGMLYDMAYSTPGNYFFNLCAQKGFALEKTGGRLADELERLSPGRHEIRIVVSDQGRNRAVARLTIVKVQPVGPRSDVIRDASAGNGKGLMQRTEFIPFVNRDDIVIKVRGLPTNLLKLRITQGGQAQVVPARDCAEGVYFSFKPLNHEPQMLLRFELSENGMVVEARQKTLQTILLENSFPQTVRFHDFVAEFGPTAVQDPTVLLLEPVALKPDLPLLAGPVRSVPVHFAFLDAVFFKFRVPSGTPQPEQLGIFKYNSKIRRWTYVPTRPDREPGYLSARVLTAGTFALLRDIFPPAVSMRRLRSRHLGQIKFLIVRLSDKGKGIDDGAIEIFLNGKRVEGDYDPDWSHFLIEDLSFLKKGLNKLLVRAADLAGNRVEKKFTFSLE